MNPLKYAWLFGTAFLLLSCQGDPRVNRDEFYQSGQLDLDGERYREAVIQFRNALQWDEKFLPARLALAKAYQKLNEHQNAINEFQRILELDSSHQEAKLETGKYLLQAGSRNPENYSKARQIAEELLEDDPTNPQARILMANAYAGLEDLERSVSEMKMVLNEDPENLVARVNLAAFQLKLQDTAQAEKTFLEALSAHPESVDVHRAVGNFYMVTGDLEKAESHFRQALELDRRDMTSLYSLVRFCLVTQQADQAEEVFKEVIDAHPDLREPRWGLGNFFVARGDIPQGLEILRALLEEDPKDRVTKLRLAELHLAQSDDEKAEDLVNSLLSANPNDAEAHYLRGRLLLTRNDPDAALEEFNRAIQLKDKLIPSYLQKASLHLARQEFTQAHETLSKVLRLNGNHLGARAGLAKVMALTRKPENALRNAQVVLAVQPDQVDALLAQGEAYLMLGRGAESEKAFQKLNELQPKDPFYLHRLGMARLQQGNDSQALRDFREALKINPGLIQAVNDIIFLHVKEKRFREALEEANRFIEHGSNRDVGHVLRGRILMAQGDFSQAERDFRKAIELRGENYQAYLLLGQLHLQQNNLEQALKEVDQLLVENDTLTRAHLLKAFYLEMMNNEQEAIKHYQRTLQLDPENPVAANNLAWIYCGNDHLLEEALTLAHEARQKDPRNPAYADTLGWIHYKMDNYTLAVDQLLFGVNNGQPKAGRYFRLGMAYYRKGDPILAKQTLRKAVEMDPSFSDREEAERVLREL